MLWAVRLVPYATLALMGSTACREPTQITLEITTDVACSDLHETSITVGTLSELELKEPSTATLACDPATGRIGSLVLIPSGSEDPAAVRVVTAIGGMPSAYDCVAAGYQGGCIVARRALRYIPHTPLYLPVSMNVACIDVPCGSSETCVDGACVPATVEQCDAEHRCPVPVPPPVPVVPAARSFGGPDTDVLLAVALDANGHVHATGQISGVVDLGTGPIDAHAAGAPLAASFARDALATRWAYAPSVNGTSTGSAVAVSGARSVFVGDARDLDFGSGITAGMSAFWAVLDADAGSLDGTGVLPDNDGHAVAVDAQGNVVVGGTCRGGFLLTSACPAGAGFVASFAPVGSLNWHKIIGASVNSGNGVSSLALRGAHLYVGGTVGQLANVDGFALGGAGGADGFVLALSNDGAVEWAATFGAAANQFTVRVAADDASVWALGLYEGSVVAGAMTLVSRGGYDVSLLRLDPSSGAVRVAASFGGATIDEARGLTVDPRGNAWLCGFFMGTGDFGGGDVTSAGSTDAYVTGVALNGNVLSTRTYAEAGATECYGIASDRDALYLVGHFTATVDFDGTTLTAAGSQDAFVVKTAQ